MSKTPKAYQKIVNNEILYRFRIVLVSGASLIMLAYYLLDRHTYPDQAQQLLTIRISISLIFMASLGLTFLQPFQKRTLWMADLTLLAAGLGICWMIQVTDGAASDYNEGLNIVYLAMLVCNSFYAPHNLCVGILIMLGYVAVSWDNIDQHRFQFFQALTFNGYTLFFVSLMTHLYGREHLHQWQTAQELVAANQKMREAEKLKDEFFANVSHELRTPLTLTLAPLESWLAGEYTSEQKQRAALETVHNNAIRLLQMVNGLLDFSKLGAGKTEVQRQSTDLAVVTQVIVDDFKPLAKQKEVNLIFEDHPAQILVDMDRYLYERILFNLLSNAIKFTGAQGRISVTLQHEDSSIHLKVQDTGIGIEKEDLPKLFQKFRQLEGSSTRRFEGTGLGLALVKEFTGLLDGTIRVSSQPGQGSTFTVRCKAPRATTQITPAKGQSMKHFIQRFVPATPTPSQAQGAEDKNQAEPFKVLIAEDNVEMASYISELLSSTCQMNIVRDGEKALEEIQKWNPDLVILDVMMPKKDGFSLCKELKSDPKTTTLPVVLLTALTHREALMKGWEAGADEYLFKPFHPKELVTRIRSMLAHLRAKKEAAGVLAVKNRELEGLLQKLKESQHQLSDEKGQLEYFNKSMVKRELVMVQLKSEVDDLLRELGKQKKYSPSDHRSAA